MISQFVTLEDAKATAAQLGDIGGGVLPYNPDTELETGWPDPNNVDPNSSGIYIPVYCGTSTPQQGDRKFYHLRFRNGAEGFNAGLVKATMTIFPTRWPVMVGTEVAEAKKV